MSDLKVDGFKSSELIAGLGSALASASDSERAAQIKKTNGVFALVVKNDAGNETTWTIDLKKSGKIIKGPSPAGTKTDVTISLSDDTLTQLATGKLNGQKAFMTGKIKTKGNIMLATKLDDVFKGAKAKL